MDLNFREGDGMVPDMFGVFDGEMLWFLTITVFGKPLLQLSCAQAAAILRVAGACPIANLFEII